MVEAFASVNNVGLRSLSTGAMQTFTLGAGAPNALTTLGMTAGTYTGTADPLTSHANGESIIDVQSDRAGGAVIMYRYNSGVNNVLIQRVDSTGAVNLAGWGANGYSTVVGAASTQEVMSCINTPVDGVIMAANMSNVIRAIRVGSSSWGGVQISATINGEIQQNPANLHKRRQYSDHMGGQPLCVYIGVNRLYAQHRVGHFRHDGQFVMAIHAERELDRQCHRHRHE